MNNGPFDYTGFIEIETPIIHALLKVSVVLGELSSIDEIESLYLLNREGLSLKTFIDPHGVDKSVSLFILWNMEGIHEKILEDAKERLERGY